MSLDAVLIVVPRGDHKKRSTSSKRLEFGLGGEWYELDLAFQAIGNPVDRALRGNNKTTDEFDDDGVLYALIRPTMVKRIKDALEQLSESDLLDTISEGRKKEGRRLRKYEHKYSLSAFSAIKSAYRLAAKKDASIRVSIC